MSVETIFRRGWFVSSVGVMAAALSNLAWSQVPPLPVPPVSEAVQDTTNAAQDTVQGATNTAQDAARNATNTAQDAANTAQDAAREATQDAARTGQEAARDATNAARETTRSATGAAQDAARDARDAAQDAARDVQGATRNARGAAQDATRGARDTARDAARGAREVGRDAARGTTRALNDMRSADLGIWFDRSVRDGLVVADIGANTALANIGFVEGDRIVSIGGRTIVRETDFIPWMLNARSRVNVVVLRDGQQQTLYVDPVVLREQVMTVDTVNVDPLENFGLILDDRFNDRLVIWRVLPRSPAFYAGLRAGDVITTVDGQQLANAGALVHIIQQPPADVIPFQITRNGRARVIEADLQLAQRRTSARQDLDAGANIRTDETYIRSNVNADLQPRQPAAAVRGQVDGNVDLPANSPPVLERVDRPTMAPTYRAPARRGVFRRGR